MTTLVDRWLPAELAAWRPAERLRASTWAEKHRVLSRMQSARPGKWRNEHAPCLAGLMDLCTRRDIEGITIVKAAQVGVSEALRNVIGYYAHQEPDPILPARRAVRPQDRCAARPACTSCSPTPAATSS